MTAPMNFATNYLRLRADNTTESLPADDQFWPALISGRLGTFNREWLVSSYTNEGNWPTWECHPNGDEVVCLLAGTAEFVFDREGSEEVVVLSEAGAFVVVPKGVWHTLRDARQCQLLFITAGEGTLHRPATTTS